MAKVVERPQEKTALRVANKPVTRIDGIENVTGAAKFGADFSLPGMLWGAILRSPHAQARIKGIDYSKALEAPGVVTVATAADFAEDVVEPTSRPHNVFAGDFALFLGEPIAAVAAVTKEDADAALELIEVDYEPLPHVLDPLEAMEPNSPVIRHGDGGEIDRTEMSFHSSVASSAEDMDESGNISSQVQFSRGDLEEGFAEADVIKEGRFTAAMVHQTYIEPHAALAHYTPSGDMKMWVTSQGQFYVRDTVARLLKLPAHKVIVQGTAIGGGFGGKMTLLAPIPAILSKKARLPVKVVWSRSEELVAANPAPQSVIDVKVGAKRDGTLTALQGRVVMDTGAYPGSPMSTATMLLGSCYVFPNMELEGFEVLTNKVSVGAYRAPGAPNAAHAVENVMSWVAQELGMDPVDFRLQNVIKEGDRWPNGQPLPDVGGVEVLEAIKEHAVWSTPLAQGSNGKPRGRGVAIGCWSGGAGGSAATIKLEADGSFSILVGTINLTGSSTSIAQVAAEELRIPLEYVSVSQGDTNEAPYGPVAGGSQITYTMSLSTAAAAQEVLRQMKTVAAQRLGADADEIEYDDGKMWANGNPDRYVTYKRISDEAVGSANGPIIGTGHGKPARGSPGFAGTIADVEVDTETGLVTILNLVGVQDAGFAINPLSVKGQIQGGIIQGVGYALLEEIVYDEDGRVRNPGLLDYRLPTAADVPDVDAVIVEKHNPYGWHGTRIVGEPSIVPPGAAITSAISDALGIPLHNMPLTPERIVMALKDARSNGEPSA